jgi:hypothetical protein
MAVMKLEITEQRPLLGGKRFGSTGSYDMLKGASATAPAGRAGAGRPRPRSLSGTSWPSTGRSVGTRWPPALLAVSATVGRDRELPPLGRGPHQVPEVGWINHRVVV